MSKSQPITLPCSDRQPKTNSMVYSHVKEYFPVNITVKYVLLDDYIDLAHHYGILLYMYIHTYIYI